MITSLQAKQIFVFGSNLGGIHGAGAALQARRDFGALSGVGWGPTGRCYAIPTKDEQLQTLALKRIQAFVYVFIDYAIHHPELEFLVTAVGTGLAGYSASDIAPLFQTAVNLPNVKLPPEFLAVLQL